MNFPPLVLACEFFYFCAITILYTTLLRNSRGRSFPRFTLYVACLWGQMFGLLLVVLGKSPFWYYWFYLTTQLLITIVQLSVLGELFREVFRPWRTLVNHSVFVLILTSLLAFAIGFGIWVTLHPFHRGDSVYMVVRESLDGAAGMVTGIGFGFVVLFSDYFGIPWRNRTFGIGLGMLIGTLSDTLFSFLPQGPIFYAAHTLCWVGAVGVWVGYFARPDSPELHLSRSQVEALNTAIRSDAITIRQITEGRAI